MTSKTIANEDRVASTIHIINNLVRGITQKRQVKKVDTDYFVLNGNTVDIVIDMVKNRAAKSAIVIDDIGLQIINRLAQEGVKDITLVIARLQKSCMNVVKYILTKTFPDIKVNIKHIEEILNMDKIETELLISNPPYGAIGANITKQLIESEVINFEEFINLLPANDYKRNKDKDLFNYQSDMEAINDGFADAAVTTHVARIHKTKVNNMTLDEFERSQYIDPQLNKYFAENSKRNHYAIDEPDCGKRPDLWEVGKTFVIGFRDANHHHLPYSKTSATYLWNVMQSVSFQYFVDNYNNPRADKKGTYEVSFYGIKFASGQELTNFINFIYSRDGFRFTSKVMTALNVDSFIALNKFLPKVDWTRSWTVEEILADYGYTEDEIKAVMDDLKNFKGMDD